MAFSHRKILSVPPPQPNSGCQPSKNESPGVGYRAPSTPQQDDIPSSPSTPQKNNIPGSPSTPQENDIPSSPPMQDHRFTSAIMFGSVLLFALLCVVIAKNYRKRNSPAAGSGSSPVFSGTEEDFLDEDHGLQVDHPIWFINTIGLPQSVLDSITAFKFKMDEGLVDGTECSVCLGEFREDEDLRLLPKCSHAFHLPCIDTWLRSHKSCPLCRSPIVVDAGTGHTSLEEPGLSNSVSEVGGLIAENQGMSGNTQPRSESSRAGAADTGAGACQKQDGPIDERAKKVLSSSPSGNRGKLQISSESVGEASARAGAMDMKIEPVRRKSSSVDVALLGILSTRAKRMKTVRYSSFGGSLQKGPIWMKRSCSCGGGRWSSRHSKSQSLEHSV